MGLLQNIIQRYREKKEKEKSLSDDIHIQKRVMAREKNANERELEGYMEEYRQKRIENQLNKIRLQKTRQLMTSNIFAQKGNMFKGKCYLGRYY
jgi:hypothetical protein